MSWRLNVGHCGGLLQILRQHDLLQQAVWICHEPEAAKQSLRNSMLLLCML